MDRRTFFGRVLSLLGISSLLRQSAAEPSYFYDWNGREPYTTDPRYAGRLTRGYHQQVFCNGVDVSDHVRRCRTGCKGWVEKTVLDRVGKPYIDSTGEIPGYRLVGNVRYRDTRVSGCA